MKKLALTVLLVASVVATALLLRACRQLRYSTLYHPDVAQLQASERRCADAAAAYLQHLANSSAGSNSGGSSGGSSSGAHSLTAAAEAAQLQINVLAAPRVGGGAGYLQQSVASLLFGLSLDGSRGAALQVLLAAPRAAYELGALEALQRIVTVAELPCASAKAQDGRSAAGRNGAACYGEALLRHSAAARYIMVVEDDAVAAPDFLRRINAALQQLGSWRARWLYLKLWYTDWFWGWEHQDTPLLIAIGVAAGVAGAAAGARAGRLLLPASAVARRRLAALLGAAAAPAATIGLLLLLGKQHTPLLRKHMPQGLSEMRDTCCTPAQVYPVAMVAGLAAHLAAAAPDAPYDLVMDDYAKQQGLSRYLLTPHPFQHIGRLSARLGKASQAAAPLADQMRSFKVSPAFAGGGSDWCAPLVGHLQRVPPA